MKFEKFVTYLKIIINFILIILLALFMFLALPEAIGFFSAICNRMDCSYYCKSLGSFVRKKG